MRLLPFVFLLGGINAVPILSSTESSTVSEEPCPPNQTREKCPPCQLTCESINNPPEKCTPFCVDEGVCICQVDWYLNDDGVCVPHVLCPKPVEATSQNPCQFNYN